MATQAAVDLAARKPRPGKFVWFWIAYVSMEDVDATAKAAGAHGGPGGRTAV